MEYTQLKSEQIKIVNSEGDTILEAPAIDLDMLFAKACAGVKMDDPYSTSVWLDRAVELLEESYQVIFTRQDAYHLGMTTFKVMEPLKKSLQDLQT